MPWDKLDPHHEAHLRESIARGRVILFTGAGFSVQARDASGRHLPTTEQLRGELWQVLFDGEPDDSTLGDIYSIGVQERPRVVKSLLDERLRVDPNTLAPAYKLWYTVPWYRIYTLNIDNLDEAVSVAFTLPRTPTVLSASSSSPQFSGGLETVHLNGRLSDFPSLTFSEEHYGQRTAQLDSLYEQLIPDLLARPILFVGSTIQEPTIWHYVALLGEKGGRIREYRPRSYIVTEHLPLARARKLERFNVVWIQASQEEFAEQFLVECNNEIATGLRKLEAASLTAASGFEDVTLLRQEPTAQLKEFLNGREPTWADLVDGYAITREFENTAYYETLDPDVEIVTVTGTAGSGKSTTLRRLALRYDADGKTALWLNQWSEHRVDQLRSEVRSKRPDAVFIDDIDKFGHFGPTFLRQLCAAAQGVKVLVAIRSTKYEQYRFVDELADSGHLAIRVPHLTDGDIGLLIDVLTRAQRLGILTGKTHHQRVMAFRRQARRQLLVAMYQATTGRRFEEIIGSECSELVPELVAPYAVACIASNYRTFLTMDELLSAIDDHSNVGLNRIERLVNMHLLLRDVNGHIRVRHRRIAELAVDHFKVHGQLGDPIARLLFVLASRSHPRESRRRRRRGLLVRLLLHDTLVNLLADSVQQIRTAYEAVEGLLEFDSHYWLQRGRFEAERGDPRLGKQFVDSARSLNPDDLRVRTGWADATIRFACVNPAAQASAELVAEALEELRLAIRSSGRSSPYPFDVFGRRVLAWTLSASLSSSEQGDLLAEAERIVEQGVRNHPRHDQLEELAVAVRKARLMTVVNPTVEANGEYVE